MKELNQANRIPLKPFLYMLGFCFFLSIYSWGRTDGDRQKWEEAGFKKPKLTMVDTARFYRSSAGFSHQVDLTLIMFRNTGWTKRNIIRRLGKLSRILASYQIKIGYTMLVIADSPNGMIDFWRPGTGDFEIAQMTPDTPRPVFYYIRSVPQFNAYSWTEHSSNKSLPEAIKNTAWISLSADMELNKKIRHSDYLTEAHELGHILLDSLQHYQPGIPNLMAEDHKLVNSRLEPHQVERIKNHRLVKRLKN